MRIPPPSTHLATTPERRRRLPYTKLPTIVRRGTVDAEPDRALYDLQQLEIEWDRERGTLWTFMRPKGRACYNTDLLDEFHRWQALIHKSFEGDPGLRYLVLGSRVPGVFSLGGDLRFFTGRIREQDREALVEYGYSCVRILHRNLQSLHLPVITIGLAQGDALGGGFESLLSFDVIVAEKGTKFGLPENLFGLFPGMGASSLLVRKLGPGRAAEMILRGEVLTAEEMHDCGLVHILAERGEGVAAVQEYIARNSRRHSSQRAVYESFRVVHPISLKELERIVDLWADAALTLREQDLRVMERLIAAQDRIRAAALKATG
jgi:DSF synthase